MKARAGRAFSVHDQKIDGLRMLLDQTQAIADLRGEVDTYLSLSVPLQVYVCRYVARQVKIMFHTDTSIHMYVPLLMCSCLV